MPVLSICIPTYNRSTYLDNTLTQLTEDDVFKNTNDVEIVISDNCSTDNTEDVCRKFKEKYGSKIVYYKRNSNIRDKNFAFVMSLAHGKYLKLNNDYLYFKKGELKKFIEFLNKENSSDIVMMINDNKKIKNPCVCETFNELLDKISFSITWIGAYCIKSKAFMTITEPDRYAKFNFSQVDMLARLMIDGAKCTIYPNRCFDFVEISNKGGYGIPEVFGRNYLNIIKEIKNKGYVSSKVFNKHKKHLLLQHINKYCFNAKNTVFTVEGYFRFLLPFYWKNLYFYTSYITSFIKQNLRRVINVSKDKERNIKKVKILCFQFKYKIRENKNHFAIINCPKSCVKVGRFTYGPINAVTSKNRSEKLIIGDFCSIGPNVNFILSSEHPYKGLSTYPFKVMICGYEAEAMSKGNIIVKDDVWIGFGAIICSGITISQGAIVAAGSVVTKDVPPYAIVGGNPAKIIKYRFSSEIINKLLKFRYSELTEEKIKKLQGALYKEFTEENVDMLLRELNSDV